jgi:uncharacterized membrane protein YhaH (DUF805 family)
MNQLSPVDWAKRPIEKYADFTGRAPRAEFWWFVLAAIIVRIIAMIIDNIISINVWSVYGPVTVLVALALLVPSIAVTVRRLHDTGRSGWWILLPIGAACLMLVFGGAAMIGGAAAGGAAGMIAGAGLMMLFGLLAIIADIVLIVFCALPGTPGDNRYGPNPYGAAGDPVAAE